MNRNEFRLHSGGPLDWFKGAVQSRIWGAVTIPYTPDDDQKIQDWLDASEPTPTNGWEKRTETALESFCSLGFIRDDWTEDAPKQWLNTFDSKLSEARKKAAGNYMFFPIVSVEKSQWGGQPPRSQFKCVLWDADATKTNRPRLNGTIFRFKEIRPARLLQYVYYQCDQTRLANVVGSSDLTSLGGVNYFHLAVRTPWNTFSFSHLLYDDRFYRLCVGWILRIQQPKAWIAFPNLSFENFCYRFENGTWRIGLIDYSGAIVYNGNEMSTIAVESTFEAYNYAVEHARTFGENLLNKLKSFDELEPVYKAYEKTPEKLWIAIAQFSDINRSIAARVPPNQRESWDARLGIFFSLFLVRWVDPIQNNQALLRFSEAWLQTTKIKKEL